VAGEKRLSTWTTVGLVYLRLHAPGVFVRVTEGCVHVIIPLLRSSTHEPPSKRSSNTGPCHRRGTFQIFKILVIACFPCKRQLVSAHKVHVKDTKIRQLAGLDRSKQDQINRGHSAQQFIMPPANRDTCTCLREEISPHSRRSIVIHVDTRY
jgi:hypothetical protein